jgi:hypothetical protein
MVLAPAASSAPSTSCPHPFPVAEVARGQALHGLTVTSGTTPTGFTGEVLGVLRDGIAPGLDMVLARLSSPELTRVGGIWQGMSGSPVYAADGRLVGAVAYSLSMSSSPVAGITPAAEMYRLLDDAPGSTAARAPVEAVPLPAALARRLAGPSAQRTGAAASGAVMRRLPVPVGVSGLLGPRRLEQVERALGLAGTRVHRGGAVSVEEVVPVVAGGNLAASISYGDVSMVGVGTATAVCGEEVVGFGHPMGFTGASRMTMHGAEAVYIQEDPAWAPFKLANVTAPVGAITQDRLSGLAGLQAGSAVPDSTEVTSEVTLTGGWSRHGTTRVSVPEAVPDVAALHLFANHDRVLDGDRGGSATVHWVVRGRTGDGDGFRYARRDRFANRQDLSLDPGLDLYAQLLALQGPRAGRARIDSVSLSSTLTHEVRSYTVDRLERRLRGRWRPVRTDRPLLLRPGSVLRLRVQLGSAVLGDARARIDLTVPRRLGRRGGRLEILGGNSVQPGGAGGLGLGGLAPPGAEGPPGTGGRPGSAERLGAESVEDVLRRLRGAPRNDQVLADLVLLRADGSTARRRARAEVDAVVNRGLSVPVRPIPRRPARERPAGARPAGDRTQADAPHRR